MDEHSHLTVFEKWRQHIAPEFNRTIQRFPLPTAMIVIATILFLIETNMPRLIGGDILTKSILVLAFSTLFAVACQLMVETGRLSKLASWVAAIIGLLVFGVTMFVDNIALGNAFMWAPILIFFTSIAPVLRRQSNAEHHQQDLFWWINHRSIMAVCIAGLAFLLIALGMVIIERSVAILFKISSTHLIYGNLLPLAGVLFAPLYWLAMIPEISQFRPDELQQPDPLSRAVGFLGMYIFTPFLCLYALILMAYAAQILIMQTYPNGTVGWMVVGFIGVASVNHLLLYPSFIRAKPMVGRFLRYWPFLAIIPLIMLVIAIQIRISIYGLTPERILLSAGALWAVIIVALGLINKLDIRLLPGLAALILMLISFGPFNAELWSMRDQLGRFEHHYAKWQNPQSQELPAQNTKADETLEGMRSAARYLLKSTQGQQALTQFLTAKGVAVDGNLSYPNLMKLLGAPTAKFADKASELVFLTQKNPFDLSGDFVFHGRIELPCCESSVGPYEFNLDDRNLIIKRDNQPFAIHDITPWINQQNLGVTVLRDPKIEITADGKTLVLLVYQAIVQTAPNEARDPVRLDFYLLEKKPKNSSEVKNTDEVPNEVGG